MKRLIGIAVFALTFAGSAARAQNYDADDAYTDDGAPVEQAYDPGAQPYDDASYVPDASQDVNLGVFQDALSPYGQWIQTADYGLVWRPSSADTSWRPYTHGRWVWTAYGWTWVGQEPWAWAPYHYGRWVQVANVGWSWVPDYTWGPAWVSFRFGPQYVGWTPLPPGYAYADNWYDWGAPDYGSWCFVNYGAFYPSTEVVNYTVVNQIYSPSYVQNIWVQTQPATVVTVGGGAAVYGPTTTYVAARVGHPVMPVAIHAASSLAVASGPRFNGTSLTVVAPTFHGVPHPFGGVGRTVPGNQTIGVGHLLAVKAVPASAVARGGLNASRPGVTRVAPTVNRSGVAVRPGFGGQGVRPNAYPVQPSRPVPSVNRFPGSPRTAPHVQAPRSTPGFQSRFSAPAPRPAPAFQAPQNRFSAPAPRSAPAFQAPQNRFSAPTPRPAPVYQAQPRYSPPAPRPAPSFQAPAARPTPQIRTLSAPVSRPAATQTSSRARR